MRCSWRCCGVGNSGPVSSVAPFEPFAELNKARDGSSARRLEAGRRFLSTNSKSALGRRRCRGKADTCVLLCLWSVLLVSIRVAVLQSYSVGRGLIDVHVVLVLTKYS